MSGSGNFIACVCCLSDETVDREVNGDETGVTWDVGGCGETLRCVWSLSDEATSIHFVLNLY